MDINGQYPMFKDLILVRWQCPKLIYALYKPCNYASCLFADLDKRILKFIWKCKQSRVAKTILKMTAIGGLAPPSFKT